MAKRGPWVGHKCELCGKLVAGEGRYECDAKTFQWRAYHWEGECKT